VWRRVCLCSTNQCSGLKPSEGFRSIPCTVINITLCQSYPNLACCCWESLTNLLLLVTTMVFSYGMKCVEYWKDQCFIPIHATKERWSYSLIRPWRFIRLWDIEAPKFSRVNSQMAARASTLCTGRPLPPGRFLVLISIRGWIDSRAIAWLEELGQFKLQWPHWELNSWPSSL
jgi:hypothetical protein